MAPPEMKSSGSVRVGMQLDVDDRDGPGKDRPAMSRFTSV